MAQRKSLGEALGNYHDAKNRLGQARSELVDAATYAVSKVDPLYLASLLTPGQLIKLDRRLGDRDTLERVS